MYSDDDDADRSRRREPILATHYRSQVRCVVSLEVLCWTGNGRQERQDETQSAEELAANADCEETEIRAHLFLPSR